MGALLKTIEEDMQKNKESHQSNKYLWDRAFVIKSLTRAIDTQNVPLADSIKAVHVMNKMKLANHQPLIDWLISQLEGEREAMKGSSKSLEQKKNDKMVCCVLDALVDMNVKNDLILEKLVDAMNRRDPAIRLVLSPL